MNSGTFQRQYTLNDNYFDKIDSENKAYFLGLLYADGHNNTSKGIVTIHLQVRDRQILDKFNDELETNKPLLFINRQKDSYKDLYRLNIVSKHMSNRLCELGCVYKKSLILKFPTRKQVPNHLLRHFIRGYFDGDGHIGENGTSCSIVSSKNFIEKLFIKLKKNKINSYIANCKNPLTKRLIINKKENSLKFLDYIYKKSNVYIQRKYDAYSIAINHYLNIKKIILKIRASKKSSRELSLIYKMSASNIRAIKNRTNRKNIK